MKKTIKLAVIAALALGTTSAFATNGINQIGVGAKARSMGGVGIATNLKGENAYSNPSMITRTDTAFINVGATLFNADVSVADNSNTYNSKYPMSVIPSVSGVYAFNDSFYLGGAIYGSGGMGVDYGDEDNIKDVKSELAIATFAVPMAYKVSGFSIGFTPLAKSGKLSLPGYFGTDGTDSQQSSTATGLGFELGADYELSINEGSSVTFAAVYKSSVDLDFGDDVLISGTNRNNNKLATPSEIGVGISYTISAHTIAFDYKHLGYGSATGFEDFDWENQDVFAGGYQYSAKSWEGRLGLNYGDTPLGRGDTANGLGTSMAYFPAVTTMHYTIGGTWNINDNNSLDLAYVYGTGSQSEDIPFASGDLEATNDQNSLALAYTYNF